MTASSPIRIAIFASGGGSNAKTILSQFKDYREGVVVLLVTNNPHSGVVKFGEEFSVPVEILSGRQYSRGEYLNELLQKYGVDLIVLAGYLKLIPPETVTRFPQRILNIHPALLPAYGGKGMYGMLVHESVILDRASHSGITIHYVNEVYDQGEIVFQKSIPVGTDWTAAELQKEVQKLEHQYFSEVVKKVCENLLKQNNNL
ncbi:MAG: phosphoribosylglycinamide formyltransferase [Bacteroidia bacterium]|nr:phosphoribosylglycinamide formyltransferase [Bacteroidia bacterium]